jgi:hypothetical protein
LPPSSALEQPLGCGRIVGWQDDQARQPLLQRQHLLGGLSELATSADTWKLAALQQVRPIAEIADQQQRRPRLAADEQGYRARRVRAWAASMSRRP